MRMSLKHVCAEQFNVIDKIIARGLGHENFLIRPRELS